MIRDAIQRDLELDTLYSLAILPPAAMDKNIWVKDGTVDIYISSGAQPADPENDMELIENGQNFSGQASFDTIPIYIYVTQNTGETTEIVLTGFETTPIVEE